MINQTDDASPEEFQKRYEDLQVQYVNEFSDFFFENNKFEEWFRERYDPGKIHELEEDSMKWAQEESARIMSRLFEEPEIFLDGLKLEPPVSLAGDNRVNNTTSTSNAALVGTTADPSAPPEEGEIAIVEEDNNEGSVALASNNSVGANNMSSLIPLGRDISSPEFDKYSKWYAILFIWCSDVYLHRQSAFPSQGLSWIYEWE